jgi:DNA gyrase subunit B
MTDKKKKIDDGSYNPDTIKSLKGIEHVRLRPAMYIGDVGEPGLHHLVNEVVDNSVDEALAGYCTQILVDILDDGSLSVEDNGRGIPVGIQKDSGRPAVEVALTKLNSGGKFDKGVYKVSGGLHGVGVSCVNALSQWMEAEIYRDGKIHKQRYERAVPSYDLKVIGKTEKTGTKISFCPDPEIFQSTTTFKFSFVSRRLRELAFLNPGLRIVCRKVGGEDAIEETYHYENGLVAFIEYLNGAEDALLTDPIYIKGSMESPESGGTVEMEIAIQYNGSYSEIFRSYVNHIHTVDGGTHVTGFKTAFTSCFNTFLQRREDDRSAGKKRRAAGKSKASNKLPSGDAYREGLVAVLSVKIPEPQFAGQNKTKLGNPDIKGIVTKLIGETLSTWIEENPKPASDITNKAMESQRVRDAVRKARDLARKTGKSMKSPKKLADCASKKPEECEIFLVEGDSAGGSARQGRNAHTQAILPLRGKILNVWKATPDKMLGHEEIKAIVMALGTGILEDFDAESCRYHKIIIMCDADIDGSHIRTLLLTFLFRQMPALILKGYIYIACPPLYGLVKKGRKTLEYVTDDDDFKKRMHTVGLEGTVFLQEGSDRRIEGKELALLKRLLERLGKQNQALNRRGLSLKEFLSQAKDDEFPYSRLTAEIDGYKQTIWTYDEESHAQYIETLAEAKRGDFNLWLDTESFDKRPGSDMQVSLFTTRTEIRELIKQIGEFGFTMDQYFGIGLGAVTDEKLLDENFDIVRAQTQLSPFRLINQDTKQDEPVAALEDLPLALLGLGKSSIKVKRYKGLGEMNAGELWDTTMDPNERRLRKVGLEDIAEAQRSFSILMGNKVEPRRLFIQSRSAEHEASQLGI